MEACKAKAANFVRNVLEDDDRASEIEAEPANEYASRKGIEITNPTERRKVTMAKRRVLTRGELQDRISELEEENEDLQTKLDDISSILEGEEEEEEDEDEENGD